MSLPPALAAQRRLDAWIGFEAQGHVRVAAGKVEIGQGIATALAQIAAEELEVDPARIRMVLGRTDETPNEGLTAGSMSVETSGAIVRLVCAEVRARFLEAAARRLSCSKDALAVQDGRILREGEATGLDYWRLREETDLSTEATGEAPTRPVSAYSIVGQIYPRIDLAERLTGAPFVHDLAFAGMRHARVLRQPWPGAKLAALEPPTALELVRIDDFVALAGDDEFAVARATETLGAALVWTGGRPYQSADADPMTLLSLPSEERRADTSAPPGDRRMAGRLEATYSRPYIAHASAGLCCAVAEMKEGRLRVWSHTQGPYPLRNALARALDLEREAVTVIHAPGAGSYGHNGADDVAFDAALIARALPERPVRVVWIRRDEIAAAPVAPAMVVKLAADLGEEGLPLSWAARIWSGPHTRRPGMGPATNLLAAQAIAGFAPDPDPDEIPAAGGGAALRNAIPLYDIPGQDVVLNLVRKPPLRTSALRSLGGAVNVLAIESFIDELALAAGRDPLAYRLALLRDPRARRVLEKAGQMGAFANRGGGGDGVGKGLAFARYKNRGAYVAIVAEVEAQAEIVARRLWIAADAGLIINPDGAASQLEGGAVQATSWTLKEQVNVGADGALDGAWADYPILRFSNAPAVEVALVGDPTDPPCGLGEAAVGPASAAIANAVAHALGMRIRDLPITREKIAAA
ncbi:MAG TPA: molybdopterin cofactor-binding domain-containing protein [Caulobacteraceae bacterium]|nr:molybdopterin cofactor-binding domain-containing protein [Caulobacteraceae bacterium]